ncbi:MAG: hypothetical protein H0T76_28615 [Nannocystis sp.]|nr:hypothetical protein [Nannocystis sp.]MBA3550457.1 hypothetical protein [Nannocystis sp.]
MRAQSNSLAAPFSEVSSQKPMLIIRDAQMGIFQRNARREFEDRLIAVVAIDYPTRYEALQEPGTRELVGRAIDLGATCGVVTKGGVTALAGLMIQYGEAFERSPDRAWAQGILTHPTLPEQLKMDMLLQRMAGRTQGRVVVAQGDG